jgi:hypothetical protein
MRSEANEPSYSSTHPAEDLECATQLNLDETSDDPINLNFDDSSRNFSDISISESYDRDIFESSPKDLTTNINEVNVLKYFFYPPRNRIILRSV